MSSGTDSKHHEFDHSAETRNDNLLPPSSPEYPVFGIQNQGVGFPALKEPVWVKRFWVGVDARITTNCPDILNDGGPSGNEIPAVYVILSRSVGDRDGGRRVPSKDFFHNGVDVRQIISIREIRKPSFVDNAIQFLLGFLHRSGIESHR
jgi:hypothetical protein